MDKELVDDYENADLIDDFVLQKTARELKEEISTLEKLLLIAKKITRSKKSEKLKEMMLRLRKEGHKKFLIFTQFRTTQNYLNEVLADFKVELFHGSLDKDQKELAIENFKSDIEVLICTEAGGEGRNMQFCNILFNYDLPWSPLKIEQRIGRLHRFGQKYDVFIYNFSTRGTVAERVLDVLIKKLNLFEESIGTPDIMLGQIEDELSLNSLFMDMVSGRKKSKIIDQEIELSINKAKKSFEKLEELTVTQKMDFNYDEYYKITRRERKFSNKQLQNFIERFCKCDKSGQKYFGKIDSDSGQIEIKNNLTDYKFHQYGTFDSEKALNNSKLEFLAFGHPSVDRCIKYSHSDEFGGMTGVQVINYKKKFYGLVFFYLITYSAISETKELIIVVVDPKEKLSDYELLEVEHEIIAQSGLNKAELNLSYKFKNMLDDIDNLNLKARDRILKKVEDKVWDIKENLDLAIDPEIEKISVSYGRQLSELNEKLAVQENKMRFEERDMKSAISRTKNLIAHTKEEMLQVLTRYQGYHSVKYKIALISAGLVKSI